MTITIRPIEPADALAARELILGMAARLFQPDATEVFMSRHGHTLEDVDEYRRDYSYPDGLFLVAVDGERLIGTAAVRRFDAETAELRRMWLLEPCQGHGIGYRLWLDVVEFARSAGYRRIRLTTDEENGRALLFYRRLGFREIKPYGSAGQDIYMELRLDEQDVD